MKVRSSKVWKEIISKDKTFKVSDGSPDLPADTVETYAQQIHERCTDRAGELMKKCGKWSMNIMHDTLELIERGGK